MTKNKKLWLINGIAFLLAFLVGLYYAVPYFQKPNVSVRAISVLEDLLIMNIFSMRTDWKMLICMLRKRLILFFSASEK